MAITYPPLSNFEALSATCLVNAGMLSQTLRDVASQPSPSEAEVKELRTRLFESAQALLQAVTPPEYTLTQGLSTSVSLSDRQAASGANQNQIMDLTTFRYVSRFNVAKGVPTTGSISYAALARNLGLDVSQLKRVLRYVMTKGVFIETQTGEVAHTETSLLLLQPGIGTMNRYSTNRGFPIAASFNEALEKWGHGAQESNQTAFNVFKQSDLAMFDYYEQNPAYAADFHNVMKFFSKTPPLSIEHIKRAFDWSSLSNTTVVDVGGSLGHCSLAILEANPTLSCVVQDLPKVITQATNPATSIVPAHLTSRISYQPHSFWDPQPLSADVYFMRMIFHDWPDKYSKKILHSLVTGMKAGARLLIMDYVTVAPGMLKPADERRMRIRDMQMMVMHNALERDEGEWRRLLAETDERLRLVAIRTPPGSALSIIEVVLDGEPEAQSVDNVPVLDAATDVVATQQPEAEPEVETSSREPVIASVEKDSVAEVSVVEPRTEVIPTGLEAELASREPLFVSFVPAKDSKPIVQVAAVEIIDDLVS